MNKSYLEKLTKRHDKLRRELGYSLTSEEKDKLQELLEVERELTKEEAR